MKDVIRTPDNRLRVFVSSTLSEPAEEREAVRQAFLQLRLTPVMFESGSLLHPAPGREAALAGLLDRMRDENAPAVAEICQRLEGLPLAIELAAAR